MAAHQKQYEQSSRDAYRIHDGHGMLFLARRCQCRIFTKHEPEHCYISDRNKRGPMDTILARTLPLLWMACASRSAAIYPEFQSVQSVPAEVSDGILCEPDGASILMNQGWGQFIEIQGVFLPTGKLFNVAPRSASGTATYHGESLVLHSALGKSMQIREPPVEWDGVLGPFVSPDLTHVMASQDPNRGMMVFSVGAGGEIYDLGKLPSPFRKVRTVVWPDGQTAVVVANHAVGVVSFTEGKFTIAGEYTDLETNHSPLVDSDARGAVWLGLHRDSGFELLRRSRSGELETQGILSRESIGSLEVVDFEIVGSVPVVLLENGVVIVIGKDGEARLRLKPPLPPGARAYSFCLAVSGTAIRVAVLGWIEGRRLVVALENKMNRGYSLAFRSHRRQ
jgi:hypothetical protein